ncbi:MAG: GntR family transcriptional regulator [Pseudomonadota bacterium]
MSPSEANSWQHIQSEVLERIRSRQWKPGELIPNETDLAKEFGCARATVNRALRAVADAGWIDRRRKAGTRVATFPERKAVLSIPVIRKEIEAKGQDYSHDLLHSVTRLPPAEVSRRLNLADGIKALELHTLHLADNKPHAYEERWINVDFLPEAAKADFTTISANEWLVTNAPFTEGELVFSAANAAAKEAKLLNIETGTAIFTASRTTSHDGNGITAVRLMFTPGYQLHMAI